MADNEKTDAPEKTSLELRLDAAKEMTPETGFNLVGMDDFEEPGDELYLIGNYGTKEEADAALEARQKEDPDEVIYIYPAAKPKSS